VELISGNEFDLELPSGRVHAQRFGAPDAPLAIGVHGLSANMHAFDRLGPHLADRGLQVVAIDLRGRGLSETSPPGTYGIESHARDLLDIAQALGHERFAVLGWSLGALVGMQVAQMQEGRLRHLVLIDHAGHADADAVATIRAGLDRLDAVVPSEEAYVGAIRAVGLAAPWDPLWERLYRYELRPAADGFTARTSKAAALEDLDAAAAMDVHALWAGIDVPTLLVRAVVPLPGGLIVPRSEAEALCAAVPQVRVVEVERNHWGVVTDPAAAEAIADFLSA
jgi:pimeloyl-ACP methyl ester carboxylesterase